MVCQLKNCSISWIIFIISDDCSTEEPRVLGLAMIPGHHIVLIHVDQPKTPNELYKTHNEI